MSGNVPTNQQVMGAVAAPTAAAGLFGLTHQQIFSSILYITLALAILVITVRIIKIKKS